MSEGPKVFKVPPHGAVIAFWLLLLCFVVRFPFFFPAVINWDESTFILMGQNVLDGQLPYVELWDLKPPGAFLAHALFIGLFGKSIIAIRLGGMLFVFGAAYMTYLTGRSIWGHRAGLLGAVLSIFFVSFMPDGEITITEVIAIFPLMAALALLVTRGPEKWQVCFAVGVLIGITAFIRLNLAYVAIFLGIYLLIRFLRTPSRNAFFGIVAYAAGGLLPIILSLVPYLLAGKGGLWIDSLVLAPLSYSGSQHGPIESLMLLLERVLTPKGILLPVFVAGIVWLVLDCVLATGLFFIATAWSIIASGASHHHYAIQVAPFLALFAGTFFDRLLSTRYRLAVPVLLVLGLAVAAKPIVSQYLTVAERWIADKPLTYGRAYEIAAYLSEENPNGEPVYLMYEHIVYWFTDSKPLTKSTTHPSNIGKEFLLPLIEGDGASTKSEMSKVLAMKPKFIVKKEMVGYLKDKEDARRMLEETLETHYDQVAVVDEIFIYKRREASD